LIQEEASQGQGGTVDTGNGKSGKATILLGALLLAGCAGPRAAAQPQERPAKPVSVRLPVLTPMKIEPPSAPPEAESSIAPADVKEGEARSLKMFQVDYGRGKPGPPVAESLPLPGDDARDVETP
jgi:hypothetical protein